MITRHPPTARRLLALALAVLTAAAALAACGSSDDRSTTTSRRPDSGQALAAPARATLVLDFVPNAVHAGIYRALAAGYYRRAGIDLRVIQPTSTADTLRLIDAGKADFGLADGLDVAGQIDAGLDIEAFMALVQRPLGGVVTRASDGIANGAELEGKTVGITGVPSDRAVLNTIVRHAGGDPAKVRTVTIGFNGVQNLEAGRIDGFTGYWPADGTQVQVDGQPVKDLKLDENGGPVYPGLVAFSTRAHLRDEPALVRAFAAATAHGYADAISDPQQALGDLLEQNPALRTKIARAQLAAYEPLFEAGAARFGTIRPQSVRALSDWMVENGLARAPLQPARFGGDRYLP